MQRTWTILFLAACPALAAAQTPQVPARTRADVSVSVGWLHVPFGPIDGGSTYDEWTRHATAAASAGVYWTDHWKTELSGEVSTRATAWETATQQAGGEPAYRSITHRIRYSQFAVAQVYQFGRNDWAHPAIGAGVLVQRRGGESDYSPAVISRAPREPAIVVDPGGRKPLETATVVAPFVTAALKAYVTPRAFFRTDIQAAFRREAESVVVHLGFGIDF